MPVDVGGAQDPVACVQTKVGNAAVPIEACDVHLDVLDTNARKQLNGVSGGWEGADKWVRDQAGSRALVFGGDFNIKPQDSGLSGIYNTPGGGTGTYHEADQCQSAQHNYNEFDFSSQGSCDRFTHDNKSSGDDYTKIDYMFFKASLAGNYSANAPIDLGTSVSDHYLTEAHADICSTNC